MNILYLAHRIPYPPHTGDKVRSFHQIRHLARNNRISLVCFVDDRSDLEHVATLGRWCSTVDAVYRSRRAAQLAGLRGLWTGRSLAVTAFQSGALERKLKERCREPFDAIVAFTAVMAPYGDRARAAARIVDFVDVDSEKWR
ncbi:MAG TPA: sugar transferase, partial [Candidatus Eisenbacteria bacterium]